MLSPIWAYNCALCEEPLRRGETCLCLQCMAKIPRIRRDSELVYLGAPGNAVKVCSWFIYNHDDISHRLIHDIKYNDRRRLARKLGRELAMQKIVDDETYKGIDLILPIPLHWTKHLLRGYNQSREIALGIADVTGCKVGGNLRAVRHHATQTRRSREERARNVVGIFKVMRPDELNSRHIAIVDDVITTGATMFSALDRILEVSRPASVTFISLARTEAL